MLKVTVITSEPFPYGGAATNRMLTYLPRLAKMGYSIDLVSFSNRGGIEQSGMLQCGAHEGINYSCIRLKNNGKVVKRLFRCYAFAFLGIKTMLSARRLDPDIVLVVTNDSFLFVLGYLTAKRCRAKYVLEKSEFPFILLRAKSSLQKLLATMNIRIFYRLFDGMLVMTKPLMDFLTGFCSKNVLLHHMPMTVDFERFARQESEKENWITYIGSFGAEKDGVGGLIDSFKLVSEKHDDWILVLIGDLVGDEAKILNDKIMKYGLLDRVILTGKISYDSVPSYLKKSRTLALSRPNTMQAHYGFPSKLGEYLATSNPVVVTDVGEIKQYLADGVSAMIAKPGDISEFAEKINFLIENPCEAQRIGQNGRQVALERFNADTNAAALSDYFHVLVGAK